MWSFVLCVNWSVPWWRKRSSLFFNLKAIQNFFILNLCMFCVKLVNICMRDYDVRWSKDECMRNCMFVSRVQKEMFFQAPCSNYNVWFGFSIPFMDLETKKKFHFKTQARWFYIVLKTIACIGFRVNVFLAASRNSWYLFVLTLDWNCLSATETICNAQCALTWRRIKNHFDMKIKKTQTMCSINLYAVVVEIMWWKEKESNPCRKIFPWHYKLRLPFSLVWKNLTGIEWMIWFWSNVTYRFRFIGFMAVE